MNKLMVRNIACSKIPMGGDGGYVPARSELVTKHRQKRRRLDHHWLESMYWDHFGNFCAKPCSGEIKLKVCVKDGHVHCAVLDQKITRPTFSFPCGCVFERSILEFIHDSCPVCSSDAECFVKIDLAKEVHTDIRN